ncbi:MAG: dihydropyrimidinase [bacterium]|nr:dihydropyrimidinase [bacterium]
MDTIIYGGRIVSEDKVYQAHIGIKGEKIAVLTPKLAIPKNIPVIDATGKYVFPGGIDVHTHFQLTIKKGLSTSETFTTGTMAAACGGITTIIDFATQQRGESLSQTIKKRKQEADNQVCIDYSLHCAITDWNEQSKKELSKLVELGIPSFKFFMVYGDRGWNADDAVLFSALEEARRLNALIMVHAENEAIINLLTQRYGQREFRKKFGTYALSLSRPNFVEVEAIHRVITWAEATGGALYIVHTSTGEGVTAIHSAKAKGITVFAESCPQYLLLTDAVFKKKTGYLYATCPPVRTKQDIAKLWQHLADGTIDIVATDTCSFTRKQKSRGSNDFRKIPYGIPGVETIIPLLYSEGVRKKRITLTQLIQLVSTNPAKLFGLYPRKGTIQVGADADLVIFDPKQEKIISPNTLSTACDWSPYQGYRIIGLPILTLCRGKIVAQNGTFIGQPGYGKFIARFISSPFCKLISSTHY